MKKRNSRFDPRIVAGRLRNSSRIKLQMIGESVRPLVEQPIDGLDLGDRLPAVCCRVEDFEGVGQDPYNFDEGQEEKHPGWLAREG